jgi:glucose-6-phosphate 1-epimerase
MKEDRTMSRLAELQLRFAGADFLAFSEKAPGFIVVDVVTPWSYATIALQGAHLIGWQPKGHRPVIWLSSAAKFAPGKSIRGGVPICWPWFGPHATEKSYPGHGFARTIPWLLLEARRLPDERVRLVFEPELDEASRTQWPYATTVRYTLTLGQELTASLETTNHGATPLALTQGLHTYFAVADVGRIEIAGLEGRAYIDKTDNDKRKKQAGRLTISGEVNRIYLDTSGCCGIIDPLWRRTILITSTGSRSTVVWNPGKEKAAQMGDFGRRGEERMVCVETTNAASDAISLPPGASHCLEAQYRILRHD